MDGLLVVDKPTGPTSHDVVARVRRVLSERRVGHTGTLDPTATGVLPLVLGRATRLARFLTAGEKSYDAEIRLGVETDSYDAAGTPVGPPYAGRWPSCDEVVRALDAFRGEVLQQPPGFSAKKVGGQRSYAIARGSGSESYPERGGSGVGVVSGVGSEWGQSRIRSRLRPLPAVRVTVHRLELLSLNNDRVALRVDCSAGFYVRSLAHDLGQRLGTGGHLAALRRTRSGDLTLADALRLDAAERDPETARAAVVPIDRMLPGLAALVLTDEGAVRAGHGRDLGAAELAGGAAAGGGPFRLLDCRGRLVGIGEASATPGVLHPSVVLV